MILVSKHIYDHSAKNESKTLSRSALYSIAAYMNPDKVRLVMQSFIISQFTRKPLKWMYYDRNKNRKISKSTDKHCEFRIRI